MKLAQRITFFLILATAFWSCKIRYGFNLVSIDERIKTVSVNYFESYAPLAPPYYSQKITESLKDIFINQTNLDLVSQGGHIQFSGEVTNYVNTPVAISGDQTAAQNKLSITVKVTFINTIDETKNFTQNFTQFTTYPSEQNLSDVEETLIDEINEQLVQTIFNKAVGDW